jgi:hypothetical protein
MSVDDRQVLNWRIANELSDLQIRVRRYCEQHYTPWGDVNGRYSRGRGNQTQWSAMKESKRSAPKTTKPEVSQTGKQQAELTGRRHADQTTRNRRECRAAVYPLPPFLPCFPFLFSKVNLLEKQIPACKHLSFNSVYQPFNFVYQPFNSVSQPFNSFYQPFNFVYQSFDFVYQSINFVYQAFKSVYQPFNII